MQTADASEMAMALNPRGGDDGLVVRFDMMDFLDAAASKTAGYPVYRRSEGVTIHAPGRANLEQQVIDLHKEHVRTRYAARFPRQYAAFKAGQSDAVSGTPLDMWPPAIGQTGIYKHHGVQTVEQLATVSDSALQTLGPGSVAMRQKAKDWLASRASNAPTERLRAENAELKNQMEVMARAIETLQQQAGIAPAPIAPAVVAEKPKRIRNRKPTTTAETEG